MPSSISSSSLFHLRGVFDVEDVGEVLDQQVVDDEAEFGRLEFALVLFDVLAILNDAHNRRIGRRPTDAFLFERFDERRLGVARRRFGEVLIRGQRH